MSASVRLLVISLATLVVAYGGLCLALYFFQARLVYFPGPASSEDPARWVPGARTVELDTSDGVRLSAWLLPAPEPRGALVFCHGNAGTIADRLPSGAALVEMGWTVLLFDYRGYGASAGEPSEEGTYRDAEAAYDWLVREAGFEPSRIAVYGESLGGGVAIELALRRPVAAVIAEATFTSLPDMGAALYPFLPVRTLARLSYDNHAKLPRLAAPVLLVHSPADEIVPFAHAERNLQVVREPRRLLRTGGHHNDGGFLFRPECRAEVSAFLEQALASARRDV